MSAPLAACMLEPTDAVDFDRVAPNAEEGSTAPPLCSLYATVGGTEQSMV